MNYLGLHLKEVFIFNLKLKKENYKLDINYILK